MSTEYDLLTESEKVGLGFRAIGLRRSIIVAAASLDPLGTAPTSVIPIGTPMGAVPASGFYKPIRRTLADHACADSEKEIGCVETTMFAAGDVVVVKAAATPLAAAAALGTIATIQAGVGITLVANATTAVTSGDIIEVSENALMEDAVILEHTVDLRGADGVAVDTGAVGVRSGQIAKAALNYNTAKGISITRLKFEMDYLMDFVNASYGTVE
jgi:hypothetical protein